MVEVHGFAAQNAASPLAPFSFKRREVGERDLLVEIQYCGVCHSDIHQVRDEWGGSIFPMVPGHEIVGKVIETGARVERHQVGDTVGIGCFVDSCRSCANCCDGEEQYCQGHLVTTYNSTEKDGKTPTYGGYSTRIVVDESFALRIPAGLDLERAAPLLCAGITTYSPLRHWKVGRGHRIGVVGLGGLGHMAVKFASSFGAEVTVFSTSRSKEEDARRLGAASFVGTREPGALNKLGERYDFLIDTVSAPHDLNHYLGLLKRDGVMIIVGVPPKSSQVDPLSLIGRRRSLAGSLIGGIRETQEMLDYCGRNNIVCDVEKIAIQEINTAYERMLRGDVKYRFVIDLGSLR